MSDGSLNALFPWKGIWRNRGYKKAGAETMPTTQMSE